MSSLDLETAFEQAPGFMCLLRGPEHRVEHANNAYLALVGKARAIVGRSVAEALPEVAAQGFIALLDGVFQTGVEYVGRAVRVQLARAGGPEIEERLVDFIYQPILGEDGRPIGIFVQGHDLTAQRVDEEARAAVAEEHRLLLELLPQQVWTATADGLLDSLNEQGERYFGVPRTELLGVGWLAGVHPDDVELTVERWKTALLSGSLYEHEFRLRGANGTYRWHLVRAIPRRGADGAVVKWLGTNTDIDDRRRATTALEQRIEYEQQLIGIVSHDLRNPLSAVGLAAALLEEHADPTVKKIAGQVANATERAGQLITDLLDFAQARSGTFPIRPGPTNLPVLTRRAVEDARMLAGPRVVEVTHTGPEVGTWDEGRIAQVIANLVGNAFQHSPVGATISVRSKLEGDLASIEIHNDGPPIPETDRARLFEPFARGKSARTHRGRSVGLGLFIARQIVLAHHGELGVHSVAGEGTTFTVAIPTRVA